ncbi:MAG: mechanosensitive ion channel family protein [Halolamina sp.]
MPLQSLGSIADLLGRWLPEWTNSPAWSFLVLVAFALLGYAVSRYVVRLLGRPIARRFRRQSVAQMVLRVVRLAVTMFFLLIGTGVVGLDLGNIVLSVTVFSAVVGIVLAPLVGSVINGLFLLADEPYEIGDMVELPDGTRGFVDDITIRYTKIFTLDNTFVVMPNDVIRDQRVVNLSAEDERTRLSLDVLVTYESDVATARALIEEAAIGADGVIQGGPDIRIGSARYPAGPSCYINEFGDNGVLLTLRYWVDRPYKLLTARSRVQTRVWELLEARDVDVEMAYPHQHLVFDDTSGEARVSVRESTGDRAESVESAALSGDGPGNVAQDDEPDGHAR